ncbi:MAG: MMPL family transporter [Xanthomonadales bacterium]|jgi:predicted exporter|nr:MMPL family transporter [Xanthomonadales bacterium]
MRAEGLPRLGLWTAALVALLAVAWPRFELSYDLGLFLPAPRTADQRVLVERLGEAPGARFLLLAVPDDPDRIRGLIESLEADDAIERVLSDLSPAPDHPPEPLWSHRFLLSDMDWTSEGLREALETRLGELSLGADPALEALVAGDPALVSLDLLDRLAPPAGAPWRTDDGRRVLVAVSQAPAFDLGGQERAVQAVRASLSDTFPAAEPVTLSGAGVFGVTLRDTIRSEATWRSLGASAAILVVLLLAYRSLPVLVLAALPLLAGLVCGFAAVALAFGSVHGITLAFGFTLLGIAIDYPLHYLSRARVDTAAGALRATWPTLRLSALSTGLAYLALVAGGAEGMAQLGVFSGIGVLAAAATTRWLLPGLVTGSVASLSSSPSPRLRILAPALLVVLGLGAVWAGPAGPWWSSDLAALSPVPAERLAEEGRLRQATGAPSLRYQVVIEDTTAEAVQARGEALEAVLDAARSEGLIEGFRTGSTLLPAAETQARRQAAIPSPAELDARLAAATLGLPFSTAAFAPFQTAAERTRSLPLLGPNAYTGTPLESALAQHLYRAGTTREKASGNAGDKDRWVLLATLRGEPDARARSDLEALLANRLPEARLVDLREASSALVTDYRQRTLRVLGGVLLAIAVLLTVGVRPGRAAWSLGVVLAAVFCTAALLRGAVGPLDLYHLTGLLLVAGIGLDYALFLGKADRGGSLHAVSACAASTVAAFGILAASHIPALHSLGSAVALGSALCFLSAWWGSRPAPA